MRDVLWVIFSCGGVEMSPKTEWSEGKGTCDVATECPPQDAI